MLPAAQGPPARAGLDGTTLKLIALVLMVLDHIHYMFSSFMPVPDWFTIAGRLVAPIYLFLLAEGFAYTHDRRRYLLRVWVVAAGMGTVSFCMRVLGMWQRADGFIPANGIFMNFPILFCLWQGIDWLRMWRMPWVLAGLAALLLPWLWPYALALAARAFPALGLPLTYVGYAILPDWNFITDGGQVYILEGIVLYLLRGDRRLQLAGYAACVLALEFFYYGTLWQAWDPGFAWGQMFTNVDYCQWMSVFSVVLLAFYNGQRGKGYRRLFYWFYPLHVYILYSLSCLLYTRVG